MFDISVEAIVFIIYNLANLIVLYAIKTAKIKRILWRMSVGIAPFLATLVMWKWGFPVFMMIVGFILFTAVSIITIIFFGFCDECGKLMTINARAKSKELFCFDCKRPVQKTEKEGED